MSTRNAALSVACATALAAAVAGCDLGGARAAAVRHRGDPAGMKATGTAPASTRPVHLARGPRSTHTSTTATNPPPKTRPREQLDESGSQLDALYAPYDQCLARHVTKQQIKRFPVKNVQAWKLAGPAAMKACLPYKPLPPWQYDPANPKALTFVEEVVACLHKRGVRYAQVVTPPGTDRIEIALGGSQNDATSISLGMRDIPSCDQQVLRAKAA